MYLYHSLKPLSYREKYINDCGNRILISVSAVIKGFIIDGRCGLRCASAEWSIVLSMQ
jgi:hypothetical protein